MSANVTKFDRTHNSVMNNTFSASLFTVFALLAIIFVLSISQVWAFSVQADVQSNASSSAFIEVTTAELGKDFTLYSGQAVYTKSDPKSNTGDFYLKVNKIQHIKCSASLKSDMIACNDEIRAEITITKDGKESGPYLVTTASQSPGTPYKISLKNDPKINQISESGPITISVAKKQAPACNPEYGQSYWTGTKWENKVIGSTWKGDGSFLKGDKGCLECTAVCKYAGTNKEGWYTSDGCASYLSKNLNGLINAERCSGGATAAEFSDAPECLATSYTNDKVLTAWFSYYWTNSESGAYLISDQGCSGCKAVCKYAGTDKEGWYTPDECRSEIAKREYNPGLIRLEKCSKPNEGSSEGSITVQTPVIPNQAVATELQFELQLLPGWNFISTPVHIIRENGVDANGKITLSKCAGSISSIYHYYPETGNYNSVPSIEIMLAGLGYWVYLDSENNCALSITGSQPVELSDIGDTIDSYTGESMLSEGWNQIGGSGNELNLNDFKGCEISSLFSYDSNSQEYVEVADSILEPGKGYWVYVENLNGCNLASKQETSPLPVSDQHYVLFSKQEDNYNIVYITKLDLATEKFEYTGYINLPARQQILKADNGFVATRANSDKNNGFTTIVKFTDSGAVLSSRDTKFEATDYAGGTSQVSDDDQWELNRYGRIYHDPGYHGVYGGDAKSFIGTIHYYVSGGLTDCRFMSFNMNKDREWLSGTNNMPALKNKCGSKLAVYGGNYILVGKYIDSGKEEIRSASGAVLWYSANDPVFAPMLKKYFCWGNSCQSVPIDDFEINGNKILIRASNVLFEVDLSAGKTLWITDKSGSVKQMHKLSNGKILLARQLAVNVLSDITLYDPATDSLSAVIDSEEMKKLPFYESSSYLKIDFIY